MWTERMADHSPVWRSWLTASRRWVYGRAVVAVRGRGSHCLGCSSRESERWSRPRLGERSPARQFALRSRKDCCMTTDSAPGLYSPGQAARLLGLPPSTLRVYATMFERVLSPAARAVIHAPGRPFRHRRYSLADVEMLGRIKALMATGLTYDAVFAQLAGSLGASTPPLSTSRPATESSALVEADQLAEPSMLDTVGPVLGALGDLLDQLDAIARALDGQSEAIARLDSRLDAIDARLDR